MLLANQARTLRLEWALRQDRRIKPDIDDSATEELVKDAQDALKEREQLQKRKEEQG